MKGAMNDEKPHVRRGKSKAIVWTSITTSVFVILLSVWGCSGSDTQASQDLCSATVETMSEEKWAAYEPVVKTLEDGRIIQKTPYAEGGARGSGYGYPADWPYYNTYVLDADKRGCNSCHDLKTAMQTRIGEGNHPTYLAEYGCEELPYQSCVACHSAYGVSIQNAMHAHMKSEAFTNMNGSCLSCHQIDEDGNYLMWDDAKYNVLLGITDMNAEAVDAEISWTQDEVTTDPEKMFVVEEPAKAFAFDVVEHQDNILETYTLSIHGEVDNPFEMTLSEMIDKFGTETRTQAMQCTINGTGGGLIYQAEVTGIPLNKVLEHAGMTDAASVVTPIGIDGYGQPVTVEQTLAQNALIVFEMNGEPLPDAQGYPCAIWYTDFSGGNYTRYLSEIHVAPEGVYSAYLSNGFQQGVYGDYIYPTGQYKGQAINTPNMGVLTVESGQVFSYGEPVHIEGYAQAFDETVPKIEFSFDRGATWREVATPNTDNTKWVYWNMDLDGLYVGSYVVTMRATSVDDSGEEHVMSVTPQFLINVQGDGPTASEAAAAKG